MLPNLISLLSRKVCSFQWDKAQLQTPENEGVMWFVSLCDDHMYIKSFILRASEPHVCCAVDSGTNSTYWIKFRAPLLNWSRYRKPICTSWFTFRNLVHISQTFLDRILKQYRSVWFSWRKILNDENFQISYLCNSWYNLHWSLSR